MTVAVAREKNILMVKKSLVCLTSLAAMALVFTSSKKENEENFYLDEIQSLAQEALVGGGTLNADSLEGKMLILSFWASYDPASRINSYNLLQTCGRYAGAQFGSAGGLRVVCVSLDTFRSPMLKAIKADGTEEFFHVCDFKGVESGLARGFDVNRPVNLLVSPDGRILARDFGTKTIDRALEMLKEG